MGIKSNFIYSSLLTVSSFLFPMLTYPYVSRVLGVTNIGVCNFVDSIINYFILFSSMGINVVGIREIAKAKGDTLRVSKVFSSLWILEAGMTAIMLFLLLIATVFISQLNEYASLMMIGACKLIANLFLIEWFYRGIEEFKYITYRSLIVKVLYVVCIFIFIHQPSDYPVYYTLSVFLPVFNAVFNIFYSRRFVGFVLDRDVIDEFKRPFFILGLYAMLTSMYTSFNVAFLGFVTSVTEVGYYTTATKLHSIILAFFSAFTGVMLPRISILVEENRMDKVKYLTEKSFNLLFMTSIPLIIFSIYFAPEIIYFISGCGYEGAITPMRMVMPLVLIIGLEQILIIQLLMPLRNDKAIFINSIIGAIVGIIANVIFVPIWAAKGSAIVWLLAEISVLLSASYFLHKQIDFHVSIHKVVFTLCASLVYWGGCWGIDFISGDTIEAICFSMVIFIFLFGILNFKFLQSLNFHKRNVYLKR